MVKTRREHNTTRGVLRKLLNKSRCDTMAILAQLNEEYGIGAGADAPATVVKIDIPADPNPMEIAATIVKLEPATHTQPGPIPDQTHTPQYARRALAQFANTQNNKFRVMQNRFKNKVK